VVTQYEIEAIPNPSADWDRRIASMSGHSLFHRSGWASIWRELYGHGSHAWIARRGGRDAAALLVIRKPSIVSGRHWIACPYFDAAGPIGEEDAAWPLVSQAWSAAKADRARFLEVRCDVRQDWPVACDTHKAHVVMDLPGPDQELVAALPKKVRSQVRRGLREGFEVRTGGAELAEDFYGVYSTRMRGLGSPAHGVSLFKAISREFPQDSRIVTLSHGNTTVSAAVLLRDGNTVRIPWAATLVEWNRLSANMVLYHACLEESVRWGALRFDFGRTTLGSSQMKFKLQWGGNEAPLYWYRFSDLQPESGDDAPGRVMVAASAVWQRLPLRMTRALGPLLVRHFS